MKRLAAILALFCLSTTFGCSPKPAAKPQSTPASKPAAQIPQATTIPDNKSPIFVITRPTIIAFYKPYTKAEQAEIDKDDGTDEAASDYDFYLFSMKKPLKASGIDLESVYDNSFRIKVGNTVSEFKLTKDNSVGYYFIAPGKQPHIEYGVETDVDIYDVARHYFGIEVTVEDSNTEGS